LPGYLLDTNQLSSLRLKPKIDALPNGTLVFVSTITLGEIAAGHVRNAGTNPTGRDEYLEWLNKFFVPRALPVAATTRVYYAGIIGNIFKNRPPANIVKTERYLVTLDVDINDVWIAAIALEHGLTLVTQDGMEEIRKAAIGLEIENWI